MLSIKELLIVLLVYIFLVTNKVEDLFMCSLAFNVSALKLLLILCPFSLGLFVTDLWFLTFDCLCYKCLPPFSDLSVFFVVVFNE